MQLSVVVTVVDGGPALDRCLTALAGQRAAPAMEVLVPFDDSVSMPALPARFPHFTFLPMGHYQTRCPSTTVRGQHELFDRRRAFGLAAARGDLVAMLEDRGVPHPDWASTLARLHTELPHAAIGGAIENGSPRSLNWAVYFCDFGRYQPPFPPHPSRVASDVNVCYKAAAIRSVQSVWADRFHEPVVNNALLKNQETIFLSPDPLVEQFRDGLRLGALVRERLGWGRLYAELRLRDIGMLPRLALLVSSPLLPVVLYVRLLRGRLTRRRVLWPFLRATPGLWLLLAAWSVGEALGYLLTRADPPTPGGGG